MIVIPIVVIKVINRNTEKTTLGEPKNIHDATKNTYPFIVRINTDSNGILIAYINYKGTPLTVCIDSGSDNLVLANRECSGCDVKNGSLISPGSLAKTNKDTLYFGTQTDKVQFQPIQIQIPGYSLSNSYGQYPSPANLDKEIMSAITLKRSGTTNYNIMGIGISNGSNCFSNQVPYDYFLIAMQEVSGALVMFNEGDDVHAFCKENMSYAKVTSNNMYSLTPEMVTVCDHVVNGYDVVIDTGSNMLTLPEDLFSIYNSTKEENKSLQIKLTSSLILDIQRSHMYSDGQSIVDKNRIKNFRKKIIIGSLYLHNMLLSFEEEQIGFARMSAQKSSSLIQTILQ